MIPLLQDIIKDAREYDLSSFSHPGGWALHPESCKFLGALIKKLQLKTILEIGSGYSSVIISREIENLPEHLLVSIDDSGYYSQVARQYLPRYNLKVNAEFYVFPIRPRIYHKQLLLFYSIPRDFWSRFGEFDLVLIDGPHHDFGREAGFYEVFPHLTL
jgi:predicted O-methyltransferase YrrM